MTTSDTAFALRRLGDEPWGRKLARSREGLSMEEVAARVPDLSRSTLSRLEARTTVPSGRKDRQRAVMVCLLGHTDPQDLGLSLEDLPTYIDVERLYDLGFASSGWVSQTLADVA